MLVISLLLVFGCVQAMDYPYNYLLDNKQIAQEVMIKFRDINLKNELESPAMNMSDYVQFFLFTRKNVKDWQELWINDEQSIKASNFNVSKPTVFVIHGYLNNVNSEAIQLPKEALLATYDCNVIAVDWSRISVTLIYSIAASETSHVGHFLSQMIKFMVSSAELDLSRTHLVGHSLGAHVAGFAGKNLPDSGLARITGLDPAKPGFTGVGPKDRLNATDAVFVDCIHTCAGDLGLDAVMCQADFFPNGGTNPQPGCLAIDFIGTCSHERSVKLYAESVYPTHEFKAKLCDSIPNDSGTNCVNSSALMGQPATNKYLGIYYVETNSEYPFAKTIL